jgi:epoxyqueuosine reductase
MSQDVAAVIRRAAFRHGFDAAGFADVTAPWPAGARLAEFIAHARHGEMTWLADTAARRSHPTAMWPQARSALMLGVNYAPAQDPLAALGRRESGVISAYAQGDDYHDLIKRRLKALARDIQQTLICALKVFVDTAPLMEKPLAQRAGLGWQGKHTNLVSRAHGSWLFLGAILLDADLAPDAPEGDHCGVCRACLDICPTEAFPAPYQLDARRCISYLTIEHKGHIPADLRPAIANRIYGCDDCLAVCPWNKFAAATAETAFHPRAALQAPLLETLAALDDSTFRAMFAKSPVKRIGRDRFVRNVMIAIGNSASPRLAGVCAARAQDASALVRAMAVWAWRRLDPEAAAAAQAAALAGETDAAVQAEWCAP